MKKNPLMTVAVLTIRSADLMTPMGRRRVGDWLRRQAIDLEKHGSRYNKAFRARYRCLLKGSA